MDNSYPPIYTFGLFIFLIPSIYETLHFYAPLYALKIIFLYLS